MKEFIVYYSDDSTHTIKGTELQVNGSAVLILDDSTVVAVLTLSAIAAVIETTSLVEEPEE